MPKIDFKINLRGVFDLLFPAKSGVDFSKLKPEELFASLPKCPDLRGATALNGRKIIVALSYKNKTTRSLIWNIKYQKNEHAFHIGAYILYRTLQANLSPSIIIPMPSSAARRRERGYNQCELLAKALMHFDPDVFKIRTDILFRTKNVQKQTFKNRRERIENMRGVFEVHPTREGNITHSETVIILDDVITTGSTLREAIVCLEKSGFKNVGAVGLAH